MSRLVIRCSYSLCRAEIFAPWFDPEDAGSLVPQDQLCEQCYMGIAHGNVRGIPPDLAPSEAISDFHKRVRAACLKRRSDRIRAARARRMDPEGGPGWSASSPATA